MSGPRTAALDHCARREWCFMLRKAEVQIYGYVFGCETFLYDTLVVGFAALEVCERAALWNWAADLFVL